MAELGELIWRVSLAEEPDGPWAVVLAGGQTFRLRHRFDSEYGYPNRYATPPGGRRSSGGNALLELLKRHRDTQWH